MMLLTAISIIFVVGTTCAHPNEHHSNELPSPIEPRMPEKEWKAPPEYLDMRFHDIESRDHGYVQLAKDHDKLFQCVDIWLKNKFSKAGVKPNAVVLDFQYDAEMAKANAFKPATTWLEYVSEWKVRGCVTTVGGKPGAISGGKLKWVAVYNHTQNSNEQSGIVKMENLVLTGNTLCMHIHFPQPFQGIPKMKLTYKVNNGYHSVNDVIIVWCKGVTNTGAEMCMKELSPFSGYHYDFEFHWYGAVNRVDEDMFSVVSSKTFPAGEYFPQNHENLYHFYCKNLTLPHTYWPSPSIMVQANEPSLAVCESPLMAWVARMEGRMLVVCYADQRGIMNVRKTDVVIDYIIFGARDKCENHVCDDNKDCIHPDYDTVACGCSRKCPEDNDDDYVCGTNMKTYDNRCELEKEACEHDNSFMYAHPGKCQEMVVDHGRAMLDSVDGCNGVYCKVISTNHNTWYKDAKIHVQITVNWMNDIDDMMNAVHDATSSWITDVTPNSFKACVMEAGRKDLVKAPYVNWFAYQGELKQVKSHRIEVGEWRSGTHCVPLHERKMMERKPGWHPNVCPMVQLTDSDKTDKGKWEYDAHLMTQIYGRHHEEWFQRMLMGYGVERMNLTSGMSMNNVTLMLTVEHMNPSNMSRTYHNAMNAWLEYDTKTQESYICLREMQNFDGTHKGVYVHWTLFNSSMIPELGYTHNIYFKPSKLAPMYTNYAFCQTKPYVPPGFNLVNSATVLVSLHHKIPSQAMWKSMRKYQEHMDDINEGMNMDMMGGDASNKKVVESWMMPHMWRANLTGWRPHMRISKDTDYSAWVEGMNETHIRVCQKSLFTGYKYEGVTVSMVILPDRCEKDSSLLRGAFCARYVEKCENYTEAWKVCEADMAFIGGPVDQKSLYMSSYFARQNPIFVAITDNEQEGEWKPDSRSPALADYINWAENNPTNNTDKNCLLQSGISSDFTHTEVSCSDCNNFICGKVARQLSCDFPSHYCNGCGKCTQSSPFMFKCECLPPYSGERCEIKG